MPPSCTVLGRMLRCILRSGSRQYRLRLRSLPRSTLALSPTNAGPNARSHVQPFRLTPSTTASAPHPLRFRQRCGTALRSLLLWRRPAWRRRLKRRRLPLSVRPSMQASPVATAGPRDRSGLFLTSRSHGKSVSWSHATNTVSVFFPVHIHTTVLCAPRQHGVQPICGRVLLHRPVQSDLDRLGEPYGRVFFSDLWPCLAGAQEDCCAVRRYTSKQFLLLLFHL